MSSVFTNNSSIFNLTRQLTQSKAKGDNLSFNIDRLLFTEINTPNDNLQVLDTVVSLYLKAYPLNKDGLPTKTATAKGKKNEFILSFGTIWSFISQHLEKDQEKTGEFLINFFKKHDWLWPNEEQQSALQTRLLAQNTHNTDKLLQSFYLLFHSTNKDYNSQPVLTNSVDSLNILNPKISLYQTLEAVYDNLIKKVPFTANNITQIEEKNKTTKRSYLKSADINIIKNLENKILNYLIFYPTPQTPDIMKALGFTYCSSIDYVWKIKDNKQQNQTLKELVEKTDLSIYFSSLELKIQKEYAKKIFEILENLPPHVTEQEDKYRFYLNTNNNSSFLLGAKVEESEKVNALNDLFEDLVFLRCRSGLDWSYIEKIYDIFKTNFKSIASQIDQENKSPQYTTLACFFKENFRSVEPHVYPKEQQKLKIEWEKYMLAYEIKTPAITNNAFDEKKKFKI